MNLNKIIDKEYEKLPLKKLAKAPVVAISGVSVGDAEILKKYFRVKTIKDFANFKYAKYAQAIVALAKGEDEAHEAALKAEGMPVPMNIDRALDKKYERVPISTLPDLPVTAIEGVGPVGTEKLWEAFKVKTIKNLATLKYFVWAQGIVDLADAEK